MFCVNRMNRYISAGPPELSQAFFLSLWLTLSLPGLSVQVDNDIRFAGVRWKVVLCTRGERGARIQRLAKCEEKEVNAIYHPRISLTIFFNPVFSQAFNLTLHFRCGDVIIKDIDLTFLFLNSSTQNKSGSYPINNQSSWPCQPSWFTKWC